MFNLNVFVEQITLECMCNERSCHTRNSDCFPVANSLLRSLRGSFCWETVVQADVFIRHEYTT